MKKLIALYFILNILSTYLLTSPILNTSIVPFERSVFDHILSFVGNGTFLLFVLVIGMLFMKKNRTITCYMTVVTFLLNMFIFLLGYYAKNYKTMLSLHNLSLFRNPNAGFAYQVVIDGLLEMVNSIQILLLFPPIILFIFYLFLRKRLQKELKLKFKLKLSLVLLSLIILFFNFFNFRNKLNKNWPYRAEIPQYGVDTCGVYNYYFAEIFLGYNYNKFYNSNDIEVDIEFYNKNNQDNLNIIDNINYERENAAIFKDMNLFVIQAEALSNFVISYKHNDEFLMPYMNNLIHEENVFYFSNMHTVVGLGNTSDAEFAFNTGYYPLGDLTINWEVYDDLFEIQGIPKMFGDDYVKYSYNPTIEDFYAHKYVHEHFFGYDKFSGFETFNNKYPYHNFIEYYLHEKWVSDEAILDLALSNSVEALCDEKKVMVFAQTISPHYPFTDIRSRYSRPYNWIEFDNVSNKFENYLNQINYIDRILYDFLLKAKDELPNTLFVIYGDHGNALSKKEFEKLYKHKLTNIEYQKLLLEVPAIIYDPSGKITDYLKKHDIDIARMLDRTLSQIDLFSTVKSMFDLESDVTLGVNMFSNEPSFAINPKTLDIIGDNFYYTVKNNDYSIDEINYQEMIDIVERIKKFKLVNDIDLTNKLKRE